MPRKKSSRQIIQKKDRTIVSDDGRKGPSKFSRTEGERDLLDFEERIAAVCHYIIQGSGPTHIVKKMKENHGTTITRQEPYEMLRVAAAKGWLRYIPPLHSELRERIKEKYSGWLQDVEVVQTPVHAQVPFQGAKTLLNLVRNLARPPISKKEVHIGFSGGHSMMMVAKEFAELLKNNADGLPQKIVFLTLVSAFEPYEPHHNPGGFFTYLVKDRAMRVDTSFVCLPSPIDTQQTEHLRESEFIKKLRAAAHQIDICVTSASCWNDKDGMYKRYMSGESITELERENIVGDFMLHPIGEEGLIEDHSETRAMTLLKPQQIHNFIKKGMQVLLVLGPCGVCHRPKTAILKALLNLKESLITHLVVDSQTASELLYGEDRN